MNIFGKILLDFVWKVAIIVGPILAVVYSDNPFVIFLTGWIAATLITRYGENYDKMLRLK